MEQSGICNMLQDERPPQIPRGSDSKPLYIHEFTLKAEGHTVDHVHERLMSYCKDYVFQLEKGEGSDYLHYQGRLSLIKKKRSPELASVLNDDMWKFWILPTVTSERTKEAFYCMKADTKVDGPWKKSDYSAPIVLTRQMKEFLEYERYPWQVKVEEWCKDWNKRVIHWVYDKQGNSGKSDLCEYLHVNKIACVVPPLRSFDDLMQVCMGMPPAKAYIIDFPRAMKKDQMAEFYSGIERMKDGYQYDKRYHFKSRYIDRPAVIVFSNVMPDMAMLSSDRWRVWSIKDTDFINPLSI